MEYRLAERDSYCRGCDRLMSKKIDMVLYFYSHRNKGQHIYLCAKCVEKMHNIIGEFNDLHSNF